MIRDVYTCQYCGQEKEKGGVHRCKPSDIIRKLEERYQPTKTEGEKMSKYQVGDYVEVSFIGKIKEVYLHDNKICYGVDGQDTYARRVFDGQINPLPTPETI